MDKSETRYVTQTVTGYRLGTYYGTPTWFGPFYQRRTFTFSNWRTTSGGYPDWKARIAAGQYAGTTLSAGRRSMQVYPNGFTRTQSGGSTTLHIYTQGPLQCLDGYIPSGTISTFNQTLLDKAVAKARTNLVKSYRKEQVAFQGGVALGELAETVRFLKSPLKSLEKLTMENWATLGRELRRLNKTGSRNMNGRKSEILSVATDSYLAYQYGAKPLVNDINDASKALTKYWEQKPFRLIRLKGSAVEEARGYQRASWGGWPDGYINTGSAYMDLYTKTTLGVTYIGALKMQNSTNTFPLMHKLGLAPDNWLPTLWEIIPYSFVIDYFSNAGKVIDAFSFQMVDLEWLIQTVRQQVEYDASNLATTNPSAYEYAYGGRVIDRHHLVNRTKVSNNYVPPLSLKLPGLGQSLNLAALAHSALPVTAFDIRVPKLR